MSSFPTSVWTGVSEDRPNASVKRGPSGYDWLRLVNEINAMEKLCDGIGLSTAGVFPGSDPTKTSQLYRSGSGTNEVQNLGEIVSTSGNWRLTITLPGNSAIQTANLGFAINAAALETAIDTALAGLSVNGVAFVASDISVSGTDINSAGGLTLTFDGTSVQKMNITASTTQDVDLDDMTPPVVTTPTPGVPANNLTLSGAGTATYPNVWDGTTVSRPNRDDERAPDADDWAKLVVQVRALQSRIQPLGLNADGTIPASGTGLWKNNGAVLSVFGQATVSLWDGSSDNRGVDVYRAPDNVDYLKAYQKVREMQTMLVPLGFTDLGALPTSDPAVSGKLWTNSGVVTVSA